MSEPLLAVDKLEVVYQRAITAVQGITLSAHRGQIVGILGTNGAGKTTLLRAISGFHGTDDARVTEGTIRFKGCRIENGEPHRIARQGMVLVPPAVVKASSVPMPSPKSINSYSSGRKQPISTNSPSRMKTVAPKYSLVRPSMLKVRM